MRRWRAQSALEFVFAVVSGLLLAQNSSGLSRTGSCCKKKRKGETEDVSPRRAEVRMTHSSLFPKEARFCEAQAPEESGLNGLTRHIDRWLPEKFDEMGHLVNLFVPASSDNTTSQDSFPRLFDSLPPKWFTPTCNAWTSVDHDR
jgi:hypothetical protein